MEVCIKINEVIQWRISKIGILFTLSKVITLKVKSPIYIFCQLSIVWKLAAVTL